MVLNLSSCFFSFLSLPVSSCLFIFYPYPSHLGTGSGSFPGSNPRGHHQLLVPHDPMTYTKSNDMPPLSLSTHPRGRAFIPGSLLPIYRANHMRYFCVCSHLPSPNVTPTGWCTLGDKGLPFPPSPAPLPSVLHLKSPPSEDAQTESWCPFACPLHVSSLSPGPVDCFPNCLHSASDPAAPPPLIFLNVPKVLLSDHCPYSRGPIQQCLY